MRRHILENIFFITSMESANTSLIFLPDDGMMPIHAYTVPDSSSTRVRAIYRTYLALGTNISV